MTPLQAKKQSQPPRQEEIPDTRRPWVVTFLLNVVPVAPAIQAHDDHVGFVLEVLQVEVTLCAHVDESESDIGGLDPETGNSPKLTAGLGVILPSANC